MEKEQIESMQMSSDEQQISKPEKNRSSITNKRNPKSNYPMKTEFEFYFMHFILEFIFNHNRIFVGHFNINETLQFQGISFFSEHEDEKLLCKTKMSNISTLAMTHFKHMTRHLLWVLYNRTCTAFFIYISCIYRDFKIYIHLLTMN